MCCAVFLLLTAVAAALLALFRPNRTVEAPHLDSMDRIMDYIEARQRRVKPGPEHRLES
jgi:hypothetical protein